MTQVTSTSDTKKKEPPLLIVGVDPGYAKTAWTAWLSGQDFPYRYDYSAIAGTRPGERMNFHGDQFAKYLQFVRDSACGIHRFNKQELKDRTVILIYSSFLSAKSKGMIYFLASLGVYARVGQNIAHPKNIDLTKLDTEVRKQQTGTGKADYPLMTKYLDQYWVGRNGEGLIDIPQWKGVDEDIIASGVLCKYGVDTLCGPDLIPKVRETGFVRVDPKSRKKKQDEPICSF